MPKVIYHGPHAAVEVAGIACERGEEVAFPDHIADALLEQGTWTTPGDAPALDDPPLGIVDYDALAAEASDYDDAEETE